MKHRDKSSLVSGKIYIHILALIQIEELIVVPTHTYIGSCDDYFCLGARFGALAIN